MRLPALAATLVVGTALLGGACGAKTGLPVGSDIAAKSSAFCVRSDFASGYGDIGIYVLLDSSGSMLEANKWDEATAALSALVDDPAAAGLEIGLQFFPNGDDCDPDQYALPAVPLDFLPANAAKIKAALAAREPDGTTPTQPALRGAIQYVRALRLADPTHDVAVVLVTDGAPDACKSSTRTVANAASEAATVEPRVSTYVVGLANGYVDDMNRIAAAGGTGRAVLISADPTTAQQLVTTLKTVRDARRLCQYAVPPAGAAEPTALDVSVSTQLSPDAPLVALPIVNGPTACTNNGGFYVDDPRKPRVVALCPDSCAAVHADTRSNVKVVVGCGEGSPDGGAIDLDAGPCRNLDITCIKGCGSDETVPADCFSGSFVCPPGSLPSDSCKTCPSVPHGCCKQDGKLATASCVASQWVCPPGATIFGTGSCKTPDVCAALLPCAPGQTCKLPDGSCGTASVPGKCVAAGTSCDSGTTQVCGCDGNVYGNACLASSAGTDVSVGATCAAPAGTFRCGPLFCRRSDEVCRKTTAVATAIGPDTYACLPQTASCRPGCIGDAMTGCSLCDPCPAGRKCGFTCSVDDDGSRSLFCTVL